MLLKNFSNCSGALFFSYCVHWSSEMQLGVIHCKACANRQPHVAFWLLKFHSFFFAFRRTHQIPPNEVQCLLCLLLLVWHTLSTFCFKSLIIVSLNSQCNHFESQLVRMMKLLRMLGSRRWKNNFFVHFWAHLLMEQEFIMWSHLFMYPNIYYGHVLQAI
jgi:hypothetical protein